MTASIPRLDWLECLWQVHIHIHTHHSYTASTMLILGWPLVKHLGEILLLKILNTCEKYKQHSNHLPKLSTHPLHALKVHICPLASGCFITLFASTAPSLSLTPNPSTCVLLFLTLKACMTASIPRLDRPEGLQSVHIHSHPHQDYTASTTLILGWPLVKHLG